MVAGGLEIEVEAGREEDTLVAFVGECVLLNGWGLRVARWLTSPSGLVFTGLEWNGMEAGPAEKQLANIMMRFNACPCVSYDPSRPQVWRHTPWRSLCPDRPHEAHGSGLRV